MPLVLFVGIYSLIHLFSWALIRYRLPIDAVLLIFAGLGLGISLAIDDFNLEEIEKLVIHRAITKYSGNISLVAKELGLSRASLYRRLEKYGL